VPATIARGAVFAVKAGLKCDSGCLPQHWSLEVRDHDGAKVAGARIGDKPWPETAALYFAEIELRAPDKEGQFGWEVVAPAIVPRRSDDSGKESEHAESRAGLNIRVVPDADHRLTVVAIDRETQQPVQGLKVVVHPYRAMTDENGVAEISLPRGQYRVFVSGKNFFPYRVDGELTSDKTIRAELDVDSGPSDAELWS
jgi:hypothetical protein